MVWVYTVVLAACSAGILATGAVLTRRLFRDETLTDETPVTDTDDVPAVDRSGAAGVTP